MIDIVSQWDDPDSWNRFVENHHAGRFSHLFEYGRVLDCYGYKPNNICFVRGGDIVAVLPATRTKSIWFGNRLVSQPFSEYGGILMEPEVSEEDVSRIMRGLSGYLRGSRNRILEMHGSNGIPDDKWMVPLTVRNRHGIATLSLAPSIDELWKKIVRYEVRKAVNKARKSDVEVLSECDLSIIERYFFPLYLDSMKRLGAPPHDLRYYTNCYTAFKDKMIIFWALKDGVRIAALLGFLCGNRISIINIVSNPQYWNLRPNDLLHWEFISHAREIGCVFFDFGSVRYEGQERFKKKWGCEFNESAFYFLADSGRAPRPRSFNSSSKTMGLFSGLWSKYMPPRLARITGPYIRQTLIR